MSSAEGISAPSVEDRELVSGRDWRSHPDPVTGAGSAGPNVPAEGARLAARAILATAALRG